MYCILGLQDALELAMSMKIDDSRVKDKRKFSIIKIIRQEVEKKARNVLRKKKILECLNSVNVFLGPSPLGLAESERGSQGEKEVTREEKNSINLEQQSEELLRKKNELKAKLEEEKLHKKLDA